MRLEAQGIGVRLGGRPVLDGLDLAFGSGSMVGIVGPNGCGKSTLLRTLAGVQRAHAGRVLLGGRAIDSAPRRMLARAMGFVPQHGSAPSMVTVREHVAFGRHPHRRWMREAGASDAAAVERAMAACRITEMADRRVERLSGGERQRVRIATALAQEASVLLLDEPLAGLDIEHQHGLLEILRGMNSATGATVVVVLHELDLAVRWFDRLVVMRAGSVVRDGPPCEVLCPRTFEDVFRVRGRVEQAGGCGSPVVVCLGGLGAGTAAGSRTLA